MVGRNNTKCERYKTKHAKIDCIIDFALFIGGGALVMTFASISYGIQRSAHDFWNPAKGTQI